MESKATNVYIAFRPNLDGFYSVLNAFLFFRDIQKANISTADFNNYISQFTSFEDINQNIFEFAKKTQPKPTPGIQGKKGKDPKPKQENLSISAVKDVLYVSIKYNPETDFYFPYEYHNPEKLKDSVLIFIGGFPNTLKGLQDISQAFRKVIFINFNLVSEKYEQKFAKGKDYPSNILHFYKTEKSGATISLEFFEKLKGTPLLLDIQNQTKLQEMLDYIEDRYCKKKKLENSEHFVSGLKCCNNKANYNPWHNQGAFKLLFDIKIEHAINIGKSQADEIAEKIQKLSFKETCEIDLGGRMSNGTPKYGRCFAVKTNDPSFKRQLLQHLALKSSEKEGFEEIGMIFGKRKSTQEDDIWEVSLYFPKKESLYKAFAKEFPDRVSKNSVELLIKFQNLKNWTPKDYFPNIKIH